MREITHNKRFLELKSLGELIHTSDNPHEFRRRYNGWRQGYSLVGGSNIRQRRLKIFDGFVKQY